MEEENKALHRECKRLHKELRKTDRQAKEAMDRADASRRDVIEVKHALTLLVDVVSRTRLSDERLEREDKLSQGHIIQNLNDQARKMEKTWGQMQLLVENITQGNSCGKGLRSWQGFPPFRPLALWPN